MVIGGIVAGISFGGCGILHQGRRTGGSRTHVQSHGICRHLAGHVCSYFLVTMQKICHQRWVYLRHTTPSHGEVMRDVATVPGLAKCSIPNEGNGLQVWEFDSFSECCVVPLNFHLSCGVSCFSLRSCAGSCSSISPLGSLSDGGVASSSGDYDSQSDYGCGFCAFACFDLCPCSFSGVSCPPRHRPLSL